MRKLVIALVVLFGFSFSLQAVGFSKKADGQPILVQEGSHKMWCSVCGMNLKMFYKTSHAVVLKDGKKKQYCSIRCLVADWPHIKDNIKDILVVDAKSGKLIDAKSAYYVVGSKVKGTMSMVSKIAFAKESDAKAFQKEFGGKITDFDTVFKMAKKSLKKDSKMVLKKKQKMMYPMGKKIYAKMCKPIDVDSFNRINELKAAIKTKKLCKLRNEKQLQAVALYLWDVKGGHLKKGKCSHNGGALKTDLSKKDKCPVCGMFVYKYPKWAAFIYYKKDGKLNYFAFDGVKDMMKFYFEPSKWGKYSGVKGNIKKIIVRDYYSLKPILAKSAWYVVGSNVYGPMGNELIPFKTEASAKNFLADHKGKKILRFNEITKELVYKLDD
jgi:nitrous oxide reductase accessory protein NosL